MRRRKTSSSPAGRADCSAVGTLRPRARACRPSASSVKSSSRSPSTSWPRTPSPTCLEQARAMSAGATRSSSTSRPTSARHQLGGRAGAHDAPLVHDHQAVAELGGLVHVVGRDAPGWRPRCAAGAGAPRRRGGPGGRGRWSARRAAPGWGRLIRARAICRRRRIPPESRSTGSSAPVGERHQLEQLVRPRARLGARDVEVARVDQQVLAHGELEVEGRLLGHHPEPPLQRARVVVAGRCPAPRRSPRVARRQAREHPHRRRLAGAVRAEEAEALPGRDRRGRSRRPP